MNTTNRFGLQWNEGEKKVAVDTSNYHNRRGLYFLPNINIVSATELHLVWDGVEKSKAKQQIYNYERT